MGRFTRNTPEPDSEPVEHAWSLDEIIRDRIDDAADAAEDTTGILRVHRDVPTGAEIIAAKEAGTPIVVNRWTCTGCSATIPLSEFYEKGHKCELSARQAGRKERFLRDQEFARRAANPNRICEICDNSVPAGVVHQCSPKTTLLPHDQAALAWQQQGARQALHGLLGPTDGEPGGSAT